MSNRNCLVGLACPQCGSEGPFGIVARVAVVVFDSGTDGLAGDVEWGQDSVISCRDCCFEATVKDFWVAESGP